MAIYDYFKDYYKNILLGKEATTDLDSGEIITPATKGVLGKGGQFKRGGESYLKDVTGLLSDPDVMMGLGLLSEGGRGKTPLEAGLRIAKMKKLLTPKDTRTSLQKNLMSAGIMPGTEAYKKAILAAEIKTEAGAGSIGLRSKANIDKANIAANYSLGGLDKLNQVFNITQTDPQAFGITGGVLRFGKKAKGELDTLAKTFARDTAKFTRRTGGLDAGLEKEFLNPNLTGIKLLENALSIRLARTRNPTGRLLKDMIIDAKEDAKLTGLGGVQEVKDKIQFLAREFYDTAANQFEQGGQNQQFIIDKLSPYQNLLKPITTQQPQTSKKPLTIEELRKKLKEESEE
jgi:hypothetical protein